MSTPLTIKDLIDLWPSRRELASDVATQRDPVDVERVHGWAKSNSIPARYHRRVIRAGQQRGISVSADLLADLHDTNDQSGRAA